MAAGRAVMGVLFFASIGAGCSSPSPRADSAHYASIGDAALHLPEISAFVEKARKVPNAERLSSHGPYTAFALSNRAVASLKDPVNWETLFWHSITRGLYLPEDLKDGQVLEQMDGKPLAIRRVNDRLYADGVLLRGPVRTGNGPLYVLDDALPQK